MEAIKLEDLVPECGEFTLSITGKTYRLNKCTIADQLWMQRRFGGALQSIFEAVKPTEMCEIALHLMHAEDKADFTRCERKVMDEKTGEVKTQAIGGVDMLLGMIAGVPEMLKIHSAIAVTIGASQVVVDKLIAIQDKKKHHKPQPIGEESLTPSQASTDTP